MIRRPPTRRPAATLLEVLIGFGIMGVAVTSIIALFPFAALTIAKALKDDRGTTSAVSGDALIRDVHKRYVVEVGDPNVTEPYYLAMDNPAGAGQGAVPGLPALATTGAAAMVPSYPVYVDPMGTVAGRTAVPDSGTPLIPRVTFQFIQAQPANMQSTVALRVGSQLDALTYNSDGVVPGGYNMRELRYSIAWMLQRPSNQDRYTVRQQVIVYDRRVHLYRPPGSEALYAGLTLNPGDTTIVGMPTSAEIRRGSWILDAGNPTGGLLQAEFYRVISATDQGNGTYTLEVHKPIVRADGQTAAYATNLVVIPAICDVFERPLLTAGTGP